VICFSGDGAFYHDLAELETARRRGIATVTVIDSNSGFGQGWPNLVRMQGNAPGQPEEMLRFGPTAFARALAMDAPVIVDVVTEIDDRAPAPWAPESA
jgi:acetolactate synthase I/II/III large subunit